MKMNYNTIPNGVKKMLNSLRNLVYDRDLSKDNKEYWKRDDALNEALWKEAKRFVNHYSLSVSDEERSYATVVLYSFIGELLENKEIDND